MRDDRWLDDVIRNPPTDWLGIVHAMERIAAMGTGEEEHVVADMLLIAALRLAPRRVPRADQINDLIAAYADVGKWYA